MNISGNHVVAGTNLGFMNLTTDEAAFLVSSAVAVSYVFIAAFNAWSDHKYRKESCNAAKEGKEKY